MSKKKSKTKKKAKKAPSKKKNKKPLKRKPAKKRPSKQKAKKHKKAASSKSQKKPVAIKKRFGLKKEAGPSFPKSPADNVKRPFNIIESYMGEYRFNDMFSVLFVCTGNMARSPMAEGVFKRKLAIEGTETIKDKFWVESCGIYAYEGNRPVENAVKVSAQHGIDISGIRSKPINRVLVEQSDLIFALSIDHLNFIQENFPTARHKSYLLKVFGKDRGVTIADSIPDPMGFSLEFYHKTFNEINTTIDQSFQKIVAMAEQKLNPKSSEL